MNTHRWTNDRVIRELAFRNDNGGDEQALRRIAAVEAEAARRNISFAPYRRVGGDLKSSPIMPI